MQSASHANHATLDDHPTIKFDADPLSPRPTEIEICVRCHQRWAWVPDTGGRRTRTAMQVVERNLGRVDIQKLLTQLSDTFGGGYSSDPDVARLQGHLAILLAATRH